MSVHQPVTIGHYTHCAERDVIAAFIARAVDWDGDDLGKVIFTSQAEELVAALREARTVRTVEELDALPVGTVILASGYTYELEEHTYTRDGSPELLWWCATQPGRDPLDAWEDDEPALVLWRPEDGDQ